MPSLTKAEADYRKAVERFEASPSDKDAKADKAKAFSELRNVQREIARAGDDMTPSKKAQQQQYIQQFSPDVRDKVAKRVFGK